MSRRIDPVPPESRRAPELAQKPQSLQEEDLDEQAEEESDIATGSPRVNPFLRFAFDASRDDRHDGGSPRSSPSPLRKKKFASSSQTLKNDGQVQRDTKRPRLEVRSKSKSSSRPSSTSEVKFYDHLSEIQDNLEIGLDIVFCGINPGVQSAEIGHHYGNPNNHFWSCLHESGLTSRRLDAREDATLPQDFALGLVNLSNRPTAEQNELSKAEQVAGVSALLDKVALYRPRILCFVGLGIADIVKSQIPNVGRSSIPATTPVKPSAELKGKASVGLQSYKIVYSDSAGTLKETIFFAVSSTSGRVVRYQKADKVRQFQDLRDLLERVKTGTVDTTSMLSIERSLPEIREGDEDLDVLSQRSIPPDVLSEM